MENTYLTNSNYYNTINERTSYLDSDIYIEPIIQYKQLPEEYDVFSEIDKELQSLNKIRNEQQDFIKLFCNKLRNNLLNEIELNGIKTVLPKFSINQDSEEAYTFNLIKNNYRIFINFEKNIKNSFYGIILQQFADSYFSTTGKINPSNYISLTNKFSEIILSN